MLLIALCLIYGKSLKMSAFEAWTPFITQNHLMKRVVWMYMRDVIDIMNSSYITKEFIMMSMEDN